MPKAGEIWRCTGPEGAWAEWSLVCPRPERRFWEGICVGLSDGRGSRYGLGNRHYSLDVEESHTSFRWKKASPPLQVYEDEV